MAEPAAVEYADESPTLAHDLFPATVTTTAGRVLSQVRVFVATDGRVWVYGGQGGKPAMLDHYVADRVVVTAAGAVEATRPDGTQATYRKEGGCGCSSPLKRWPGPWSPMRMGT